MDDLWMEKTNNNKYLVHDCNACLVGQGASIKEAIENFVKIDKEYGSSFRENENIHEDNPIKELTLEEKNALAQEFIKRVNPYEKTKASYIMDLRAYAKYVKENNIDSHNITAEIMAKFLIKIE